MKLVNLLIISIFMVTTASAQFASSAKRERAIMVAVGAGGGMREAGNSAMGANLMVELRKPIAVIASHYSVSVNLMASALIGKTADTRDAKGESVFFPNALLTLNFNAYSQATKMATNALGIYVGAGLLVAPRQTIEKKDVFTGEVVSVTSGLLGPAVSFGPRFRLGRSYMDLRVYGGLIMGDAEVTYGGLNLMFTLGMGKKKIHGMR